MRAQGGCHEDDEDPGDASRARRGPGRALDRGVLGPPIRGIRPCALREQPDLPRPTARLSDHQRRPRRLRALVRRLAHPASLAIRRRADLVLDRHRTRQWSRAFTLEFGRAPIHAGFGNGARSRPLIGPSRSAAGLGLTPIEARSMRPFARWAARGRSSTGWGVDESADDSGGMKWQVGESST